MAIRKVLEFDRRTVSGIQTSGLLRDHSIVLKAIDEVVQESYTMIKILDRCVRRNRKVRDSVGRIDWRAKLQLNVLIAGGLEQGLKAGRMIRSDVTKVFVKGLRENHQTSRIGSFENQDTSGAQFTVA